MVLQGSAASGSPFFVGSFRRAQVLNQPRRRFRSTFGKANHQFDIGVSNVLAIDGVPQR